MRYNTTLVPAKHVRDPGKHQGLYPHRVSWFSDALIPLSWVTQIQRFWFVVANDAKGVESVECKSLSHLAKSRLQLW